ncbi:hypothetical protein B0H13DRAFT_2668187 [Mycena leptocephala]|nr:hypothetical protein B0H13DRAFT_2668187 [Mycena leptocephala]
MVALSSHHQHPLTLVSSSRPTPSGPLSLLTAAPCSDDSVTPVFSSHAARLTLSTYDLDSANVTAMRRPSEPDKPTAGWCPQSRFGPQSARPDIRGEARAESEATLRLICALELDRQQAERGLFLTLNNSRSRSHAGARRRHDSWRQRASFSRLPGLERRAASC